jgi:hypothetical protein
MLIERTRRRSWVAGCIAAAVLAATGCDQRDALAFPKVTGGSRTVAAEASPQYPLELGFRDGLTGWSAQDPWTVASDGARNVAYFSLGNPTYTPATSALSRTFDVPSTGGVLNFRYSAVCVDPDGGQEAGPCSAITLRDEVTGTTVPVATPPFDLSGLAGHRVTLIVSVWAELACWSNIELSDVRIDAPPPRAQYPLELGFRDGLTGWSAQDPWTVASDGARNVAYFSLGNPTYTPATSALSRTFDVPSTGGVLNFRYSAVCVDPDGGQEAGPCSAITLRDEVTGTTVPVANPPFDLSGLAGHRVTLIVSVWAELACWSNIELSDVRIDAPVPLVGH